MKKIKAIINNDIPVIEIIDAFCDICGTSCMTSKNTFEGMDLKAEWVYRYLANVLTQLSRIVEVK